jgi:hypothetical protein
LKSLEKYGAPGEIRTHDLCLRRAALYPAELRVLAGWGYSLRRAYARRLRAFGRRRIPHMLLAYRG